MLSNNLLMLNLHEFAAVGRFEMRCASEELAIIEPPSGQTCAQYMANFISFAGGYLQNPSATTNCEFCPYQFTDQFLGMAFNIYYKNRWRNIGLLMVYVAFNVSNRPFVFLWWKDIDLTERRV